MWCWFSSSFLLKKKVARSDLQEIKSCQRALGYWFGFWNKTSKQDFSSVTKPWWSTFKLLLYFSDHSILFHSSNDHNNHQDDPLSHLSAIKPTFITEPFTVHPLVTWLAPTPSSHMVTQSIMLTGTGWVAVLSISPFVAFTCTAGSFPSWSTGASAWSVTGATILAPAEWGAVGTEVSRTASFCAVLSHPA